MKTEKLSVLKKELNSRSPKELAEICLRLAKLKTENKEMLDYLLNSSDDPMLYAATIKKEMDDSFQLLSDHYYHATKSLRKILRLVTKYRRFTASKEGETELLLYFMSRYLERVDHKTRHKPLQNMLTRVQERLMKLIPALHEDLQFDYTSEYNKYVDIIESRFSFWDKLNRHLKL